MLIVGHHCVNASLELSDSSSRVFAAIATIVSSNFFKMEIQYSAVFLVIVFLILVITALPKMDESPQSVTH